jgi:glycosyltransferase involved in cell wall biosynthesis
MSDSKFDPEISVVIPVKDRLPDLKLAVTSVLRQTVSPNEIIIVDDASDVPINRSFFPASLVPIRILRNRVNLGAAGACNAGLEGASSSIVAFLDSDDYFLPTYIELIKRKWGNLPSKAVGLATGFWWCNHNFHAYRYQTSVRSINRKNLLVYGNFVGGNSILSVRRDSALAINGLPNLRGSSDWGFLLNMTQVGEIHSISTPLVLYRSPSTSVIDTDTRNYRRQIISIMTIRRQLPASDKIVARKIVLKLMCSNMVHLQHRRLLRRLMFLYLRNYGLDYMFLRTSVFPAILGARNFNLLLRWNANIRAAVGRILGRHAGEVVTQESLSAVKFE